MVADFVVLTKLLVVQHRASVHLALKVQILAPRFKFCKRVISMTMFGFPFFPNVFPVLLISLCFSVSCTGFSNCNAVNYACQSHQDLANSVLMPYFLSIIIFSASYDGNCASVIPSSCPDIRVYLVLLSTYA